MAQQGEIIPLTPPERSAVAEFLRYAEKSGAVPDELKRWLWSRLSPRTKRAIVDADPEVLMRTAIASLGWFGGRIANNKLANDTAKADRMFEELCQAQADFRVTLEAESKPNTLPEKQTPVRGNAVPFSLPLSRFSQ